MDPNPLQNAKNHRVKGVGRDLQSPTPAKQPHNSTGGPGLPQRTRSPPGQPPPPHQLHLIQRYRHEMSAIPPRAAPSAATHASWRWRSRWSRWGPTTPSSSRSTARWTPGASAAGAYCGRRGGRLSAAPLRPRGAPRGDAAAAISPPASSIPPPRRAARPPFSPLSPPRAGDAAAPAGGTGRTPRPEAAEPRSAPAPIPAPRSPSPGAARRSPHGGGCGRAGRKGLRTRPRPPPRGAERTTALPPRARPAPPRRGSAASRRIETRPEKRRDPLTGGEGEGAPWPHSRRGGGGRASVRTPLCAEWYGPSRACAVGAVGGLGACAVGVVWGGWAHAQWRGVGSRRAERPWWLRGGREGVQLGGLVLGFVGLGVRLRSGVM